MNLELELTMFKKKPVLTYYHMIRLNRLSLALEIWSGLPVMIRCFDFNTGNGRARIGTEEKTVYVHTRVWEEASSTDLVHFTVDNSVALKLAHFKDEEMQVHDEDWPTMQTADGPQNTVWVGTSYRDRRLNLYFRQKLKARAVELGLTWDQFLGAPSNAS